MAKFLLFLLLIITFILGYLEGSGKISSSITTIALFIIGALFSRILMEV